MVAATKDDVNIFRDWLVKQPYLPQDVDDDYIKAFIIGAKGSIERAKTVYDHFYRVQQTMPDLFKDWDPLGKRAELFNSVSHVIYLPKKTPENYTVCMSKFVDTDPTHYSTADVFVRFFVLIQILLWENKLGDGEAVFVMDATGITISHMTDINPVMAKQLMDCILNASPVRIKAIHLLNLPPMFEWAVTLFKQLMPEKMRKRLHLHNSTDSLKDVVPLEILPKEYGGEEAQYEDIYRNVRKTMEFHRERIMKQRTLREKELQFRPKKNGVQEMSGTFRKLELD